MADILSASFANGGAFGASSLMLLFRPSLSYGPEYTPREHGPNGHFRARGTVRSASTRETQSGLDFRSRYVLFTSMSDHPPIWRMPTPKQMAKLAAEVTQKASASQLAGNDASAMPAEYWDSVLNSPQAEARSRNVPVQQRRLSEIPRHVLRVSCRRCDRFVEIQMVDAVRLYGQHAIWKDVGMRLLDNTCRERIRRYEEDGCWPAFE